MKKRILSLLLGISLCIGTMGMFVGCGGDKDNTLNILLLANSAETAFYTKHFNKIEQEKGITIQFEASAWNQYYDTLTAAINGGNTPDIIYMKPSDMLAFIEEEVIVPIEEYVDFEVLNKLYANALRIYKYKKTTKTIGDGELYAVPKDLSVQQLGYNKALVQRSSQKIKDAGLKLPWEMDFSQENYTWDEYKRMAQLCISEDPLIYGCDLPDIEILTWNFGGQLISADNTSITVNNEPFKKAVLYQAELLKDEIAIFRDDAEFEDFIAGKLAFYSKVNSYDIKNFNDYFGNNWDIMPWPTLDTAKPNEWTGKITSAGFAVSSGSKNKELAAEVIMTLISEQTQDQIVAQEQLALPIFVDVAENSYFMPEYDDTYSPKNRKVYIDVISGRNGKFAAEYSTYDMLWKDHMRTNYLDKLYIAKASNVMGLIYSDAQYATLQTEMQQLYNETLK